MDELDRLTHDYCELHVTGGSENLHGKVNILLQTYLSRGQLESFSLISDQSYIIQVRTYLPAFPSFHWDVYTLFATRNSLKFFCLFGKTLF